MDPKVKEMWLNALRSGEYTQTTAGCLKDPTGFCCLAVLCDIYSKQTGNAEWEKSEYYDHGHTNEYFEGEEEFLPESVVNWAGLECENPEIPGMDWGGQPATLSVLNDQGRSFTKLADLIEMHL